MKNKERPEVIDAFIEWVTDSEYSDTDFIDCSGYDGHMSDANEIREWLNSEYVEPYKITQAEKCILENVEKDHEFCFTLVKKNIKGDLIIYEDNASVWFCFWMYNHLFPFIEKDKTYVIEDILNNCEVIEDETL